MFRESVRISWSNIINNKMRSFLTILGIVIGVGSIIALITIVQGATDQVTSQVASFGADKITVSTFGTPLKRGLLDRDIKKLTQIENVAGVSPTISKKDSVVFAKRVRENVSIQGKNEVYFDKTRDLMENGRPLNILDIESKNKVCLIGANVSNDLFWGINPIGRELRIGGIKYKIVGTLKESFGFTISSNNDAVIIPYTTAMSFLGTRYISSVEIFMADSKQSETITTSIKSVLNEAFNYKDDSFTIFNMQDILTTILSMTAMLSLMLGGIASISLVVGGIGIMNMMLVSVTERTSEIGLRKALGAEPRRIQQQFLIEAVVLSVFGGAMGLFLGVTLAFAVCNLIGVNFSLAISTVLLALGFSAAIGIIFGFAPARKASRLNPIDALRSV
ncbi:MAG: ABC transporter permease [Bacillota bacterium]